MDQASNARLELWIRPRRGRYLPQVVELTLRKMNNQAFKTLEFDSLRALLRRGAHTEMGRARFDALEPSDDLDELQRHLRALAEAVELRARGVRFSFEGLADPTNSISRLRIEGTALEPLAILDLARLCERAMDARAAILAEREGGPT